MDAATNEALCFELVLVEIILQWNYPFCYFSLSVCSFQTTRNGCNHYLELEFVVNLPL